MARAPFSAALLGWGVQVCSLNSSVRKPGRGAGDTGPARVVVAACPVHIQQVINSFPLDLSCGLPSKIILLSCDFLSSYSDICALWTNTCHVLAGPGLSGWSRHRLEEGSGLSDSAGTEWWPQAVHAPVPGCGKTSPYDGKGTLQVSLVRGLEMEDDPGLSGPASVTTGALVRRSSRDRGGDVRIETGQKGRRRVGGG